MLTWIGGTAWNRNGDLVFQGGTQRGQGIYLWQRGRLTRLVHTNEEPRAPGNANIHWFNNQIALNGRGQVVVWANYDGGSGLLLFSDRTVQSVIANGGAAPGGGTFQGGVWQVAVDERGRVAFLTQPQGGTPGLFLWDGGQIRKVRQTGQPGPGGLPLTDLGPLVAAGDTFYVSLRYGNGQETTIEAFDGAAWRVAVASDFEYRVCNSFSAATNGDVVFMNCGSTGGVVLRKRDGKSIQVVSSTAPSAEGDWFLAFLGAGLTEQGEVLFSAVTPTGSRTRVGLFQAVPR